MKVTAVADEPGPVAKFSFSFYPADLRVVQATITGLRDRGISIDRTKVVRGLLHTTPEQDLFAFAVQHLASQALTGAREKAVVAERFTIVLPTADVKKVDRVVRKLDAAGMKMNDSSVLRSLLRSLPPLASLVPVFKKYVTEFPDGRSRAARSKKHA